MPTVGCDYHVHTPRCKHAAGPLEAYIERALELGLEEIGFSDHNPLPDRRGANVRMEEAELADYVADVLRLREQYRGQIAVRLGLEMDYVRGLERYLHDQVSRYPWDYVIGSIHYLDPACTRLVWGSQPADVNAHYDSYFELVRELGNSGLCDFIAHFDVPRRASCPPPPAQEANIAATLTALRAAGVGIEVNTSGFRHSREATGPYPAWPIVAAAIRLGVPLTVNSDAHAPAQVGTEFAATAIKLAELGCQELRRFSQRTATAYPLASPRPRPAATTQ